MVNRVTIYFLLILCIPTLAQGSNQIQYEQMITEMNGLSLPLVNIVTDVDSLSSTFYPGYIEFCSYDKTKDLVEKRKYPCDLRYRGGSSLAYEKKSFAFKLRYENGDSWDTNLFGIRKESSWILDAMSIDRIRMRNRLCFDLWNEFSKTPYFTEFDKRNGTKGQFVEVFLNGNYHGLYCLTDKINRKLLNLRSPSMVNDSTVKIRGVLYKGQRWQDVDGEATDIFLLSYKEDKTDGKYWNAWELQHPEDYPSKETWQQLMDLIDFCSSKTPDIEFINQWKSYFDPTNLADYMVLTFALNVGDNAYKNTFLSTQDITVGHQFIITPWDMDMSFGGYYDGGYNDVSADIHRYDGIAPYNRLFSPNVDGFYSLVKMKWELLRNTVFSISHVFELIDKYAQLFVKSGAWARECSLWNARPVPLKDDIYDEIDYVKNWYIKNYNSLIDQFTNTGIQQPTNSEPINKVYGIDGRKISINDTRRLSQGLYIINGKKIIVR